MEGDVLILPSAYVDIHKYFMSRFFKTHACIILVFQDGIPRTAYKGVVVFHYQTPRRIFLVSPDSLRQLGIEDS